MLAAEIENPRAVIGDNNPPEPTPYQRCKDEIQDLFDEATNFLDGAEINSQELADAVGKLMKDTAAAMKRADEAREAENKPLNEKKAEVQARYNGLIGDTKTVKGLAVLTIETCKKALAPFIEKQEAEKRAAAAALRAEADERERIAREAMLASQADLAARQRAEQLADAAKAAAKAATTAEKDRAAVRGGGRAITSRARRTAVLADYREAMRHAFTAWPAEMTELLERLATRDMNERGKPVPPGFDAREVRSIA